MRQPEPNKGNFMSQEETEISGSKIFTIAVPKGRNIWEYREANFHYASRRLIRVEGAPHSETEPDGLTGTLYVVVETFCRENRRVMRVERQKFVKGELVNRQNWGEFENTSLNAA